MKRLIQFRYRSDPASGRAAGGSALIVVLWVIGIMSILISSFSFDAHIETRIVSYYRKRAKAESLSNSGLEIARMLMAKSRDVSDDDEDEDDRWLGNAKDLKNGVVRDLKEELAGGTVTLNIIPEPARRNINSLGSNDTEIEENLERILEVGGIPEDMWSELIESFLDWTDKDDEARFDGGETEDHYETLEPPYMAKNGPLDTVEELLLIKGFTRTILNGGTLKLNERDEEGIPVSGIGDLLTTYGSGKVNVNAASSRVLMTLYGVDELIAGAIIQDREGWVDADGEEEDNYYESAGDLFARIPDLDASLSKNVETDSSIYRVSSVGEFGGVQREVWCIAAFDGKNKDLKIKRWREQD